MNSRFLGFLGLLTILMPSYPALAADRLGRSVPANATTVAGADDAKVTKQEQQWTWGWWLEEEGDAITIHRDLGDTAQAH